MSAYPPEAWAREADRYQRISDERRAKAKRQRRASFLYWLAIALPTAAIIVVLALNVRA